MLRLQKSDVETAVTSKLMGKDRCFVKKSRVECKHGKTLSWERYQLILINKHSLI